MHNRVASYQELIVILRVLLYDKQHGRALERELGFSLSNILLRLEGNGLVKIKADKSDSKVNLYTINSKRKKKAARRVWDGVEHFRVSSKALSSQEEMVKRFESEISAGYEWEKTITTIQEIKKDPKKEEFFNYLKDGHNNDKVVCELREAENILPSGKESSEYLYYFKQIGVITRENQEEVVLNCEFSKFVDRWEQFVCIEQVFDDKYKFLLLNRIVMLCRQNENDFDGDTIRNDFGEGAFNWLLQLDKIGLINLGNNTLRKQEILNFFYNLSDLAIRKVLNEK